MPIESDSGPAPETPPPPPPETPPPTPPPAGTPSAEPVGSIEGTHGSTAPLGEPPSSPEPTGSIQGTHGSTQPFLPGGVPAPPLEPPPPPPVLAGVSTGEFLVPGTVRPILAPGVQTVAQAIAAAGGPGGETTGAGAVDESNLDPFELVDVGLEGGAAAVLQVPRWIVSVQKAIGGPVNRTTATAYEKWAKAEGMPDSANNPLAATDVYPGSIPFNPQGVQRYPNLAALAAVYKRKFTSSTYKAIGAALKTGDDLEAIYVAINKSPWCSGCQGGHYPVDLYDAVYGHVAPTLPSVPVQPPQGTPIPPAGVDAAWRDLTGGFTGETNRQSSDIQLVANDLWREWT
jgi:hypothetical protein